MIRRTSDVSRAASSGGLVCEWCEEPFQRASDKGPVPRFCSAAHRQAAHRDPGGKQPKAAGPVERKVRADVDALLTAHPMGEGLAEMAFTLARTLDQGAGMAAAAVSRELRATLTDLAGMVLDDDDDFETELSSKVRDAPEPGEGEPGAEGGGGGPPPR